MTQNTQTVTSSDTFFKRLRIVAVACLVWGIGSGVTVRYGIFPEEELIINIATGISFVVFLMNLVLAIIVRPYRWLYWMTAIVTFASMCMLATSV